MGNCYIDILCLNWNNSVTQCIQIKQDQKRDWNEIFGMVDSMLLSFFFYQKGMVTVLVKKDVSVLMFPVLQWCYKRDVEITILSFVNTGHVFVNF